MRVPLVDKDEIPGQIEIEFEGRPLVALSGESVAASVGWVYVTTAWWKSTVNKINEPA